MGSIDRSSSPLPTTSAPPALASHLLPRTDSPNLILSPATLLERVQCWHINYPSWKGRLSLPQYLLREYHLGNQDLTADGAITYWILTLKEDALPSSSTRDRSGEVARPILGACETFAIRGFVARHGRLENVACHAIGSVFVRDEYRGRGYAGRMMDELALTLNSWQQPAHVPRGYFSVLFSDIGKKFYAKHGWKPMPSTHIILSPVDQAAFNATVEKLDLPNVKDLQARDIATVCEEAMKQAADVTLQRSRQKEHAHKPQVTIHPDAEHMAWHHAREEYFARNLLPRHPHIKGAVDPETGCAAIWTRIYGDNNDANELHILHLHIPAFSSSSCADKQADEAQPCQPNHETLQKSIAALLLRAQREAHEWDMRAGVELWSPADATLSAAKLLDRKGDKAIDVIIREKESICSMRWIGGAAGAGGEKPAAVEQEVDWIANEKYAWC